MDIREPRKWEPLLFLFILLLFISLLVFPAQNVWKGKETAQQRRLSSRLMQRYLNDEGFSTGTLRKDDIAPDFEIEYLDGGSIRLSDLARRHRLVVLNFFATWCSPCREELPELSRLGTDLNRKGLLVLSVSSERAQKISDFAGDRYPGILLARDKGGMGQFSFGVSGIPATFVLSPDLEVLAAYSGFSLAKTQELRRKIDALLESEENASSAPPPAQVRERSETRT